MAGPGDTTGIHEAVTGTMPSMARRWRKQLAALFALALVAGACAGPVPQPTSSQQQTSSQGAPPSGQPTPSGQPAPAPSVGPAPDIVADPVAPAIPELELRPIAQYHSIAQHHSVAQHHAIDQPEPDRPCRRPWPGCCQRGRVPR